MTSSLGFPATWAHSTIGDHVRFEGGTQPPRSTFVFQEREGYIRLVQTRDFKTDKYKTFIPATANYKTFTENDIMIGRYGPPVFQIYRGLKGAYNVALIKASPKTKAIDSDYLFYTLRQDRLFTLIDSLSRRSSGQTGIDMDALKRFPLLLPPLDAQRTIVSILQTWDEAIDNAYQLCTAKRAHYRAIRRSLMSSSDEGLLRLSEITKRVRRVNDGQDHPVMTISAKSGFILQSDKYSRDMAGTSLENYIVLHQGEFAYNKGNSLTSPQGCIFRLCEEKALVPHVYFCFSLKRKLHEEFFVHLFESGYLNHQLSRVINSGVRNDGLLNLNAADFFNCRVPVPPVEEQARIAEILNGLRGELAILDKRVELLERQKRGLMQKLLTGDWRVN